MFHPCNTLAAFLLYHVSPLYYTFVTSYILIKFKLCYTLERLLLQPYYMLYHYSTFVASLCYSVIPLKHFCCILITPLYTFVTLFLHPYQTVLHLQLQLCDTFAASLLYHITPFKFSVSNFLLIRVLHLDDNDVKTNYRRIFSTVSASTPFSTQIRFVFVII